MNELLCHLSSQQRIPQFRMLRKFEENEKLLRVVSGMTPDRQSPSLSGRFC